MIDIFGSDPPKPDPAIGEASLDQVRLSRDIFNHWKNVLFPEQIRLARDVVGQQVQIAGENQQRAGQQWREYQKGLPIYDRMLVDSLGLSDLNDEELGVSLGELSNLSKSQAREEYRQDLARLNSEASRGAGKYPASYWKRQRANLANEYKGAVADIDRRSGLTRDLIGAERAAAENQAGIAGAGVQGQIDTQRQIAGREMARMGVDPTSGRYQYGMADADIRGAAARAGAMNMARNEARRGYQAQRGAALDASRGYQSGPSYAAALSAGNSATGNMAQPVGQYVGVGQQAMSQGIGGLNSLYGNQLNAWGAQQQANSQLMGDLGGAVGYFAGQKWGG